MSRIDLAWALGGVVWLSVIAYLSLDPAPPQTLDFQFGDKLGHFLAYLFLMSWFAQLSRGWRHRLVMAGALFSYGVLIEYLQAWGGVRYFEVADMAANATGLVVGLGLSQTRLGRVLPRVKHRLAG